MLKLYLMLVEFPDPDIFEFFPLYIVDPEVLLFPATFPVKPNPRKSSPVGISLLAKANTLFTFPPFLFSFYAEFALPSLLSKTY